MNGFLTDDFIRTGRAGMIMDIGKIKKLGALSTIEIDQNRNRDNSNKNNTRFNNQDNNLMREFSNRKDKSKDLRFSNHDTLNLKGNLKEGSEVEKAGRIEVGGDTTISSNDI